jgi:hypothetical protein
LLLIVDDDADADAAAADDNNVVAIDYSDLLFIMIVSTMTYYSW